MQNADTRKKTLFLVQFSLLLAIEAIVCFIPLLGAIPFTPVVVATLSHIPVIVTAVLLGTQAGAAMGFFFGAFSLIIMSYISPGLLSFAFSPIYGNAWSLVICFVPRILIGVVTGATYKAFFKRKMPTALVYTIPPVLGSLTTTALVVGGIWLFFGTQFAETFKIDNTASSIGSLLMTGIILPNGIPEAIVAGIVGIGVCFPLKKMLSRRGG